jgi:N-acylneuraminate cytidylyltransferase
LNGEYNDAGDNPRTGRKQKAAAQSDSSPGGKPLIVWTIEAALACSFIDTVCVSTDSEEIRNIALDYGAETPFLRPVELGSDTATSVDVAEHALRFYEEKCNKRFDTLILLQPTSPLRGSEDIRAAMRLYAEKKARNVVSVCETEHSPLWCNTLPPDASLVGFIRPELKKVRSQDLPIFYRINGAIYIVDTEEFATSGSSFLNRDPCLHNA